MTKSPAGDDIVILSRAEYDALAARAEEDGVDVANANAIAARIAAGNEDILTSEETTALLEEKSPLRFWRRKRGLTQSTLSKRTGLAQGYLSDIESGKKTGDVRTLRKIADALGVTIDDLAA